MSARAKSKNDKKQKSNTVQTSSPHQSGGSTAALSPRLQQARGLIQKGDYIAAANLLASAERDQQTRNTLGVCLMRAGCVDKAVDVFRSFVLMPGTVLERRDVSNTSKRNFATALLMKGFPSGASAVLAEIRDPQHPMTIQLEGVIRRWERSLSWFRWLDWKLNGIEPKNTQVSLGFEPGEFEFEVQIQRPVGPDEPGKNPLKLAA